MYWHEKIAAIKQMHSTEDFSVLSTNRKEVLRKIETKFIKKPPDYYDLNNFNERFCNWWSDLTTSFEARIDINPNLLLTLSSLIEPEESYWIACEFAGSIMIYKAKRNAILDLIYIGRTWTKTLHLSNIHI
ncbi:MAG: hypothetical protein AAFX87_23280 [Bacteroidota bacterium]